MTERIPPKLEYDRSSVRYVTRRAFNVLLLLTLANLFFSFQFLYYPKASAYVRQRLEQHRAAVARAAAVRQQLALEQK